MIGDVRADESRAARDQYPRHPSPSSYAASKPENGSFEGSFLFYLARLAAQAADRPVLLTVAPLPGA
jgi:hypothetical protein